MRVEGASGLRVGGHLGGPGRRRARALHLACPDLLQRDWSFIATQPASAPHMLRIVPHTVPRVGRSCEHLPDGFELHLLLTSCREREFFIDNLMVRIHLTIVMILVDRPCAIGV